MSLPQRVYSVTQAAHELSQAAPVFKTPNQWTVRKEFWVDIWKRVQPRTIPNHVSCPVSWRDLWSLRLFESMGAPPLITRMRLITGKDSHVDTVD